MSHALTAARAPVFIIFHAGISASNYGFYREAVAQYPMVTVSDTSTVQVAPVNNVFHTRKERDLAYVVVSVMSVHSQEVSLELAARPVA